MQKLVLIALAINCSLLGYSQQKPTTSTTTYHKIKKLAFLGRVMYVAAHPDDENTNVISHFSNTVHATTAYLSLTRGDGGQNLVGPELREALGVIRTQELLAARAVDGGKQWFTRANDFGYSKHPTETFTFWDKETILHDVVWAFRSFKPDVIINRFDHRTPGTTHGHHTTSAILSVEAFDKINDPKSYPKQLVEVSLHQPTRLYLNKSSWFYKSKEDFERDASSLIKIPMDGYSPSIGLSTTEIASISRSQHKSQGFGTLLKRGEHNEYFELIKGNSTPNATNVFESINTTWSRVAGGKSIATKLKDLIENYNFVSPSVHIETLLDLHKQISGLSDNFWKNEKLPLLEEIIAESIGLYAEAYTGITEISPDDNLPLSIEVANRSAIPLELLNISFQQSEISINQKIKTNKVFTKKTEISPKNISYTTPYYLTDKHTTGLYTVSKTNQIGLPETKSPFLIQFHFNINGSPITLERSIQYKFKDRVAGEVHKPIFIVPEISVTPTKKLLIFSNKTEKELSVTLNATTKDQKGALSIDLPETWTVSPKKIDFALTKGTKNTFIFKITPPSNAENSIAKITATSNGKQYSKYGEQINYEHIPPQQIIHEAEVRLVNLELKTGTKKIAYIQGAGDLVAKNLQQVGMNITTLDAKDVYATNLSDFDVILFGIRTLNKYPELANTKAQFHSFIEKGGTLIVQYHTKPYRGGDSKLNTFFPYSFSLSRDRVTDETANVNLLAPKHPVLNTPNKITTADFENWVQERGLYFADKWNKKFTPILGMHDAGEKETKGSLLIAPFGKGHVVYTGISFFRELPEGVAGAYRLLANLINL